MVVTLKKRDEFVRLTQKGKHAPSKSMILQAFFRADDSDQIRLGFTVSSKVGNAVVRNRIKRRLRVVAREILLSEGKAGYDYVLVGRKQALEASIDDLKRDLRYVLKKVHAA